MNVISCSIRGPIHRLWPVSASERSTPSGVGSALRLWDFCLRAGHHSAQAGQANKAGTTEVSDLLSRLRVFWYMLCGCMCMHRCTTGFSVCMRACWCVCMFVTDTGFNRQMLNPVLILFYKAMLSDGLMSVDGFHKKCCVWMGSIRSSVC